MIRQSRDWLLVGQVGAKSSLLGSMLNLLSVCWFHRRWKLDFVLIVFHVKCVDVLIANAFARANRWCLESLMILILMEHNDQRT